MTVILAVTLRLVWCPLLHALYRRSDPLTFAVVNALSHGSPMGSSHRRIEHSQYKAPGIRDNIADITAKELMRPGQYDMMI
jgi:hypothetical protein